MTHVKRLGHRARSMLERSRAIAAPPSREMSPAQQQAFLKEFATSIDAEKERRRAGTALPPSRASLLHLVYRWAGHYAEDDPPPLDLERELLKRLGAKTADAYFVILDTAERFKELSAAGERERFFTWPTRPELAARIHRQLELSEAVAAGTVPREAVPLFCRPLPDGDGAATGLVS
ncbi:MAG TPA: hypothetical protein VFG23_05415 [Polyangia bacterium]|jgi:hypothetical protein|nr:hypothetical protein [Polyangia bacterium]